MKLQVYALLLTLLFLLEPSEAVRRLRPRQRDRGGSGYRRKKVSLLKSVKIYYKDPARRAEPSTNRLCYRSRSRLKRRLCHRPRKLRLTPSRSDIFMAEYDKDFIASTVSTTTTTTTATTTTTYPKTFSPEDFGPYFSEIAKAFAQSLESGAVLNQVQYNSGPAKTEDENKGPQCPKVPTNPPVCASSYAMHECWSVGQKDADCKGDALCCFNGCENVCYTSSNIKVGQEFDYKPLPPPPQPPPTNSRCPTLSARSYQACQNSRPNCWSAGDFDLDCPNAGLCCFDGCVNTCLDQTTETAATELPVKEVTTRPPSPLEEGYNHPSVETNGYSSINQREPTLVLHIFGPPQSKPQVLFGELAPPPPATPPPQRFARQIKKSQRLVHFSVLLALIHRYDAKNQTTMQC